VHRKGNDHLYILTRMRGSGYGATSGYDGTMDEPNIDDLIARGVIKAPRKKPAEAIVLPHPSGRVSDHAMGKVWREEREDRWLRQFVVSKRIVFLGGVEVFR
jgi:hypothetical protein